MAKIYNPFGINFSNSLIDRLSGMSEVSHIVIGKDYHEKRKERYVFGDNLSVPSSIAIASRTHIFPRLYMGIGCGMLTLRVRDFFVDHKASKRVFDKLAKFITGGLLYHLQFKLGLNLPLYRNKFDLGSKKYRLDILRQGSSAVTSRKDLNRFNLIDNSKQALSLEIDRLLRHISIPKDKERFVLSDHFFGSYFGGNHFFEIQRSPESNDLFISLHTGGDDFNEFIDKDSSLAKYIFTDQPVALDVLSDAGKDFIDLSKVVANFSYAARTNAAIMVADFLNRFYKKEFSYEIVSHSSHNLLEVEDSEVGPVYVHRHNMVGTHPGQTGFLSGYFDTFSYLYEIGPTAKDSLYSIDHGMQSYFKTNGHFSALTKTCPLPLVRARKSVFWGWYREESRGQVLYDGLDFIEELVSQGQIKNIKALIPIYNFKSK